MDRQSSADNIVIELAYALADRQTLLRLTFAHGTTLRQAVLASGMDAQFPGLDLAHCPVGIFGKVAAVPEAHVLQDGERVEIYRPLLADPKDVRRQRAAKAAKTKAAALSD
ncbi:MAG: RnfH family protein [Pseudomonas sp.]